MNLNEKIVTNKKGTLKKKYHDISRFPKITNVIEIKFKNSYSLINQIILKSINDL